MFMIMDFCLDYIVMQDRKLAKEDLVVMDMRK